MHPLIERFASQSPVVTDGAWGTELQARGLGPGEAPDRWNLSHSERVAEVARAYVQAGSQIILSNTFGANRVRLADQGASDQMEAINRAGVEISRRSAADGVAVFASIGPSGKMFFCEEISSDELQAAFEDQARVLAAAGADGLVIETMGDLEEAKVAVQAARVTGLPVVACMVFDSGKDGDRTLTGITPEQAAEALTAAGADVIGANCGHGIGNFISLCQRLRQATDRPIWIKANAGLPELVGGRATYRTTPADFARRVPELIAAGATFVGGCCGTTPEFIRAICEQLPAAARTRPLSPAAGERARGSAPAQVSFLAPARESSALSPSAGERVPEGRERGLSPNRECPNPI